MFGKKTYSFTRKSAVKGITNFIEKGANFVASMDISDKPMGQRLEQLCAQMINNDEDVQILIRRISSKFGIDAELIIVPKFNDVTLLIEKYILATPNSDGILTVVVDKGNVDEMVNYLTEVCLTRDEAKMEAFCKLVEKVVGPK